MVASTPANTEMNKRERFLFSLDHRKARNECSLNGLWQLQPGTASERPREFQSVVPVPGLVDLAEPPYDWDGPDFHWYRTEFELADHEVAPLVFLRIGQAQYGTAVWLNGKEVGSSISCYTSQEYRIDPALQSGLNELIVRVGAKRTLPPESAVGNDQEQEHYIPGVWGDVSLVATGNPRIKHVQVIPHIDKALAETRVTLENLSGRPRQVSVTLRVREKRSGVQASDTITQTVEALALQSTVTTVYVPIEQMQLWSPDSPFLYILEVSVIEDGSECDAVRTVFGMRSFQVRGRGFYLNNRRIFLRGGNIAFHRFLSDPERKLLPWDKEWVKRLLIDIPKEHNFNFFRNHLGHIYSAWYDLADEHGMLIQDEWHFWTTTGTKEQIRKEFTEWIMDNCNHPSIVIWDPLNESTDAVVQQEIVPEMKKLDPTRPWESVDFVEEHPYIYSLGPVLNNRKFGFTRALSEIEHSATPAVLNEFIWWWLNSKGEPTKLMKEVVERWLGPSYSREDLLHHQAFLAQELVELFRRMRVDAIQPFVYLSNGDGPTAHWFLGPIADLQPKPILAALKNAFQPFGVSIELWDRHFFTGESRWLNLWVFNDTGDTKHGTVRLDIVDASGKRFKEKVTTVVVPSASAQSFPLEVVLPVVPGTYQIKAELHEQNSEQPTAISQKVAYVFSRELLMPGFTDVSVCVLENGDEYKTFLKSLSMKVKDLEPGTLREADSVVLGEGMLCSPRYQRLVDDVSDYVAGGGAILLIEPEYSIRTKSVLRVLRNLELVVEPREERDRGGYDSYLFPTDFDHPLWKDLHQEQLKMFNGGYGGEIVSEHNVTPSLKPIVHACCGLGLKIPAVMEIPFGSGTVIISRLQLRNRLAVPESPHNLYSRRVDPVLQQYVLNLFSYSAQLIQKKRFGSKKHSAVVSQRRKNHTES
jgi:beta-galactosidase